MRLRELVQRVGTEPPDRATRSAAGQATWLQIAAEDHVSTDEARARRANAWTRVYRPGDPVDMEAEDALYWLRFSLEERVLFTWRLSEEIWSLAGATPNEPGLSRSTTRVHRG